MKMFITIMMFIWYSVIIIATVRRLKTHKNIVLYHSVKRSVHCRLVHIYVVTFKIVIYISRTKALLVLQLKILLYLLGYLCLITFLHDMSFHKRLTITNLQLWFNLQIVCILHIIIIGVVCQLIFYIIIKIGAKNFIYKILCTLKYP